MAGLDADDGKQIEGFARQTVLVEEATSCLVVGELGIDSYGGPVRMVGSLWVTMILRNNDENKSS